MRSRRFERRRVRTERRAAWRWALAAVSVGLLGCSATAPPPRSAAASAEALYLLNPVAGFKGVLSPELRASVERLHGQLLFEGPGGAFEAALVDLQRSEGERPVLDVLAAESRLVERRLSDAAELVEPIVDSHPGYTSAILVLARISELQGDLPRAFELFASVSVQSTTAAARSAELRPRVVEILANRLALAIDRGQLAEASGELGQLEEIAAGSDAVLQGRWRLAAAAGDDAGELQALATLLAARPGDRLLLSRRADLELALGQPRLAVEIFEELLAETPRDRALASRLAVAKFYWRLGILPPDVRQLADLPVLDRAQYGRLLFWLVPGVRSAGQSTAQIATDILDHSNRGELVRVINLHLMDVDPALHQFFPDRPVTRLDVLSSLLRALARASSGLPCLSDLTYNDRPSVELSCGVSSLCNLLDGPADCLPAASLSGREALEMVRRALVALESAE